MDGVSLRRWPGPVKALVLGLRTVLRLGGIVDLGVWGMSCWIGVGIGIEVRIEVEVGIGIGIMVQGERWKEVSSSVLNKGSIRFGIAV